MATEKSVTMGKRLKAWRKRVGLSQDGAAKRLGTSQRTWAAWEMDGTTPEVDYCEAIEDLTGGEVAVSDWARARRNKRRRDGAGAGIVAEQRKAS